MQPSVDVKGDVRTKQTSLTQIESEASELSPMAPCFPTPVFPRSIEHRGLSGAAQEGELAGITPWPWA